MTLSAAPIEIAVTIVAGIGVALRSWALREAWTDYRLTRCDPAANLLMLRDVFTEIAGMGVKLIATGLGWWAMTNPADEAPRASTFWTVVGISIIAMLVIMDTISFISAVIRRRVRAARDGGSA